MSEYRPDKIESYWQNIWSEKDSFKPRPVSENRPGSILRTIQHAELFLDQDSSSNLLH